MLALGFQQSGEQSVAKTESKRSAVVSCDTDGGCTTPFASNTKDTTSFIHTGYVIIDRGLSLPLLALDARARFHNSISFLKSGIIDRARSTSKAAIAQSHGHPCSLPSGDAIQQKRTR
ncbi:hypothetical protein J6590_051263 [Homalodisca vitripennis]|nr:hypothetical protein J6590_051263 [Homalodisca vitripennis]